MSDCTFTHMNRPTLSTAEIRKPVVAAAAVQEFARGGYHGTTIADVARTAKISPAYVIKLFPTKERLFVTALERCFDLVVDSLAKGADEAEDQSPDGVLFAMGGAYAHLIADKTLLMLQVHAQSVAELPEIGGALRAGIQQVVEFAKSRSRASDEAVQRFIAYGQLCHLIVTAQVEDLPDAWAHVLTDGIRHPG